MDRMTHRDARGQHGWASLNFWGFLAAVAARDPIGAMRSIWGRRQAWGAQSVTVVHTYDAFGRAGSSLRDAADAADPRGPWAYGMCPYAEEFYRRMPRAEALAVLMAAL